MGRFRSQLVGMDIDRGSIKAVQLYKGGGGSNLQHVGYRRLAPGAIVDGEVADHDLLASEIKEFWSSHSFSGKSVSLGIANQKVVVRLLDFPRMSEKDLKSAINFEAQDHIPMPIDEAVMDYVVLGPQSEGSDLDRILIVAAQRDMISRYTSAVRNGGLRAAGIDVKALSLIRSTLPNALFEDEGAIVLLDIATELSNLVVSQSGLPTLTRFIPGGAQYFSGAVAEAANMPEEEAERQLMNPNIRIGHAGSDAPADAPADAPGGEAGEGGAGTGGPGGGEYDDFDPALIYDVRRGLEDAAQGLAEDVQRSIEYHYSQPDSREVSQVFISGEGALVNGLDSYLGELLGITTNRGAPLQKLSANKSNVADEQLRVMEPVLAVAIGLALEDQ